MPDEPKISDEQEQDDIQAVRNWCNASHVDDADAKIAFSDGRGVFDVSGNGAKLTGFLQKHHLESMSYRNSLTGLCGNHLIHMAFRKEPIQ
jgi:hypothetical protein